ncbi:small T antigen [Rousettus leschenaultii polyomavirus 1]|nr:small T antigen [Rousettus leschenaultii polyomavirus 1]
MDHILTREESLRLMQLLELPPEHYGNLPLMRKAFLKRCKDLHPDKGGDQEKAKELITLYRKLESHVSSLDTEESFTAEQVCEDDFFLYIKDWVECNMGLKPCVCLFCLLRQNHKAAKGRPKVWGQCYCFKCYCTWFGLEWSWMTWLSWRAMIAATPYHALNL